MKQELMPISQMRKLSSERGHGAKTGLHFSTSTMAGSRWAWAQAALQGGDSSSAVYGCHSCDLHKDSRLNPACGPRSDLRGEKDFLICTVTVCWPTLKPKGRHPPRCPKSWQLPSKGETWRLCRAPGAGLVVPGRVTYEHD